MTVPVATVVWIVSRHRTQAGLAQVTFEVDSHPVICDVDGGLGCSALDIMDFSRGRKLWRLRMASTSENTIWLARHDALFPLTG